MLSVGSRKDARKGLAFELGRGGGGVGMEENEVEEGEACSSEEDDAAIDPDVTLSYIDEKIRDILGHFQKDFEGGVSAENLGSKFGGYGSFLPTCPRSPSIWSHSRSPERAPNHYAPMSSCNRHAEGACHDPAVSISASVTLKNNSVPVSPQLNDTKKNEVRISAPIFGEGTLQNGVIPKPFQSNHQTILKVRIKVCPDNVLPRPNAAIYSDMGLDYSPSSSPEDSPSASGGFSLETHDVPSESPMSVFKIMTSFPVCGGCVLSPLPESLLHLMKNERLCLRDCKPGTSAIGVDTCNVFKNDAPPENNEKVLFGKKTHHVEKNMKFSEIKNLNCKADLRNEFDIEMPDGRMLVSDSLNTPKRSCSVDADEKAVTQPLEDAVKGSGISQEANKILSKDNAFSCDLSKEEPLESVPILDTRMLNNAGNDYLHLQEKLNFRTCSSDKVLEEGKMSNHKSVQFDPQNKGSGIAEKKCDAFNYATDGLKVRKDTIVNPAESINLKAPEKSILHEEEGERVLQARDYHSGMRRKSKGSEINGTPCVEHPKENTKVVSSVPLKEKNKSSHSNRSHLEDKRSALKCHKKSSRILNKESDSLGETKAELIEHGTDPMKTIFRDKAKDPRIGNEAEKAKDSLSVKEVETPPMPEADGKSSYVSSSMANGPMPDTAPAPLSHDVIEENWVCCDKCQKWRLLPYGTDPAHLPKKWICAMLSWLFCAHEYEKRKEMAAAALAYKCMEVAYMKVVFSKHYRASKDRQDLQTALHLAASGESPSSSASDIDNVNNLGTLDKTSSVKIVSSQVAGAHAIAARSRPLSVRLLDFVQYVNNAMEASRKSHNAFTGANVKSFESHSGPEGIASVRKVLDFSFHDVDGLLQLVRLSMDAIGR
uniref:MORC family CW-type zinc finger protein 4 n=1 Tax=Anthurium amnicola TaxID=1678845 RepID=A0A1D1XHS9_9ARAE